jgi:hypothetical protein
MSKLNIMITDKQITDKETELCYYYVRFRVIRPEYVFTPLMYLPIETIKVEYKYGLTNGYMLCIHIGKELDINPDHIRIDEFQYCS